MDTDLIDLAILGGGPAGMSAALMAGRCRLRTAIVNAERPRNRVTGASHGFLTRDGAHPLELLAIAKQELEKYPTVAYHQGTASSVRREGDGFVVTTGQGTIHATRVLIATGFTEDVAAAGIPDLAEVYGTSVFPCPFCDGFEHADQRLALFASEGAEAFVPLLKMWSDHIMVFSNGDRLADEARRLLAAHDVPMFEEPIEALTHDGGRLQAVVLAGGPVPCEAGFILDYPNGPATSFADDLGVPQQEAWGMTVHEADEHGRTPVPGVYIVGDARTGFSGISAAVADGAACVEHIVHDLASQRWAA